MKRLESAATMGCTLSRQMSNGPGGELADRRIGIPQKDMDAKAFTRYQILIAFTILPWLLAYFVTMPSAKQRPATDHLGGWALSAVTAIGGWMYVNARYRLAQTDDRKQTEMIIGLGIVEFGMLIGTFILVPQGYAWWAAAAVATIGNVGILLAMQSKNDLHT